jgi:hypothetical protein
MAGPEVAAVMVDQGVVGVLGVTPEEVPRNLQLGVVVAVEVLVVQEQAVQLQMEEVPGGLVWNLQYQGYLIHMEPVVRVGTSAQHAPPGQMEHTMGMVGEVLQI